MGNINHIAVVVVVVVSQMLGYLWYSVLFGRPWALGYRLEADALKKTPPTAFIITIVGAFLFTYGTAFLRGMLGVSGFGPGLLLGAGLWLGIIAPRYALHGIFGKISLPAMTIDAGFDLIIAAVTGGILALWIG